MGDREDAYRDLFYKHFRKKKPTQLKPGTTLSHKPWCVIVYFYIKFKTPPPNSDYGSGYYFLQRKWYKNKKSALKAMVDISKTSYHDKPNICYLVKNNYKEIPSIHPESKSGWARTEEDITNYHKENYQHD